MFVVIMGVCGSGKTTVGRPLAECLGVPFLEGDEFHSPANIAKMSCGTALDDADRRPWLESMARAIAAAGARGEPGLVLACSALKRCYRDVLRRGNPVLRFVYLTGDPALIARRLGERKGHYMPATLLESQLETLEEPAEVENACVVDIGQPLEDVVRAALAGLDAPAEAIAALAARSES